MHVDGYPRRVGRRDLTTYGHILGSGRGRSVCRARGAVLGLAVVVVPDVVAVVADVAPVCEPAAVVAEAFPDFVLGAVVADAGPVFVAPGCVELAYRCRSRRRLAIFIACARAGGGSRLARRDLRRPWFQVPPASPWGPPWDWASRRW